MLSALEADEPETPRRARVLDLVDAGRDLAHAMSWREYVTNHLSQACAAWFDRGAGFAAPRAKTLYGTWRERAARDHAPALLMGFADARARIRELPTEARELVPAALAALGVPADELEPYLLALLLDLGGWASWCAWVRWTARLEGRDDDSLVELLAMRLAWEWMLHDAGGPALAARWRVAIASWPAIDRAAAVAQGPDWVLQRAVELAWQEGVCRRLPAGLDQPPVQAAALQAVFCIDVRSEVFRRALEAEGPGVQTLGFAGFFGLPADYLPLAATAARPQLPGLLAPRMRITDTGADDLAERRARRLDLAEAWKAFKAGPSSAFSFVEAFGLLSAGALLRDGFGLGRPVSDPERAGLTRAEHDRRKPRLTSHADGRPLGVADRVELAASILRAMSLGPTFARIVLLVGHGSSSANNPHAAGLACGACCGQTGEVNARALAALLEDPEVRAGLAERGVRVPPTTRFLAALHDTTTDEVRLLDVDEVPPSHRADLELARARLAAAADRARAERAPRLGLAGLDRERLEAELRRRASDWSQVRPEWGLADNAAFVVAPREHVRHLDLGGRAFLHDYRWRDDEGFAVLELLLTAPMVVTHWINFQYYASTVDPLRYGSGNKVLHNVVGGHLGVFEGNGGDLRIGLPLQSVHDGERWVHTPLRLSVFVEAPAEAIDAVLRKHGTVRDLVRNEWLHLFRLDEERREVLAWSPDGWIPTDRA